MQQADQTARMREICMSMIVLPLKAKKHCEKYRGPFKNWNRHNTVLSISCPANTVLIGLPQNLTDSQ